MTSDHDNQVQSQFGASAENYRTSASHARGRSLERLLALTAPQPQWLVLDAATGAGHTAAFLAPHVERVVAGDMTWEMLQQARIVSSEQNLSNVLLVRESARDLSYGDSVFNLVTCRVAAHHFPDPGRFVAECARVLKPGGLLVVIDNIVPDDPRSAAWMNDFERERDPSHACCLSLPQWRELFTVNGLEIVHMEVDDKWFDFAEWMRRMNVAEADIERLGENLLDAPGEVEQFWHPRRRADGTLELALQEAIIMGRS